MLTLWLLFPVTVMAGGMSNTTEKDCSFTSLLRFLKLDTVNEELAEVRPVRKWQQTTLVRVDMALSGIPNVDENSFLFIESSWKNPLLMWDPNDFCGITHIIVPSEKLWTPDIIIVEEVSDSAIKIDPYAVVYSNGSTKVTDRLRLSTSCDMDLYQFPFDTQNCPVTFRSIAHTVSEIKLEASVNKKNLHDILSRKLLTTQGEWKFLGINMTMGTEDLLNHSDLKYKIILKRRPLLYIINLMTPVTFFMFLDLASFSISEARGEKLGFKVTLLLSISVLLMILADILPCTAERLPLMAMHCIVVFSLTFLSVLETMLVSFLVDMDIGSGRGADVQPSSRAKVEAQEDPGYQQESEGETQSYPEKTEKKGGDVEWLRQTLEEVRAAHRDCSATREEPRRCGYYERVARRLDTVYFCVYLMAAIGFLTFMIIDYYT